MSSYGRSTWWRATEKSTITANLESVRRQRDESYDFLHDDIGWAVDLSSFGKVTTWCELSVGAASILRAYGLAEPDAWRERSGKTSSAIASLNASLLGRFYQFRMSGSTAATTHFPNNTDANRC